MVNETLRDGLTVAEGQGAVAPFKVQARPLHARPGISLDSIGDLLEQLDGPAAP